MLQIGENNLENLAKAVELGNSYGYDQINFNCGCPSPKVAGHGCFGVRLMLDPKVSLFRRLCVRLHPTQMSHSASSAALALMIMIHIMSFVHIEQGPVLDSIGLPLAVVKGIAGQT